MIKKNDIKNWYTTHDFNKYDNIRAANLVN